VKEINPGEIAAADMLTNYQKVIVLNKKAVLSRFGRINGIGVCYSSALIPHKNDISEYIFLVWKYCCLAVTGGGSTGKCGRLSKPSWLLVGNII